MGSPSTRLVTLLLLVAAADGRADDAAEAQIRFELGLREMKSRRFEAALGEFFTSNRLSPNPSTTFNVASCLEYLGRFDEAYGAYSDYRRQVEAPADVARAEEALARIRAQVAILQVASEPAGAAVFVDRKNLGRHGVTPRELALAPGRHELILELPFHHDAVAALELVRGTVTSTRVRLTPRAGRLEVRSEPAGAEVLDPEGELLGLTPLSVTRPLGRLKLEVRRSGYLSLRDEVELREDAPARLAVKLTPEPPPTGRLRVLASVDAALVRLDGRDVGFTPLVLEAPVGGHALEVHRPGHEPWAGELTVVADRLAAVEVVLAPEAERAALGPWPIVFGSVSLLGGVTAGVLGGVALAEHAEYRQTPTAAGLERTQALNAASDAALGVSLVAGVACAAWLLAEWLTEPERTRGVVTDSAGAP